jgi:glycogen debranching enzyme
MQRDSISILEGNAFVVSDRRGDIEATPSDTCGLFLNDTRFLSRFVLTVNGHRPNVLTIDELDYFKVQFFMAVTTGTVYVDSHLSVVRRRSVADGFNEEITIINHANAPVDIETIIEADADFADLFEVKDKLEKKGRVSHKVEGDRLALCYERETFHRQTWITAKDVAEIRDRSLVFRVTIAPHAQWSTSIEVVALLREGNRGRALRPSYGTDEVRPQLTVGKNFKEWVAQAPKLTCSWSSVERTYRRSIVDLAGLRFQPPVVPGSLPAAGLPWFMAIFGRDSIITSLQSLPFTPELASTTLRILALFQARVDDAFRDAEPGKILHELRLGELTAFEERPHSPYYGTADATPLFLILLEEYERWTGNRTLVSSLEKAARAAVEWIDKHGDRDGDGYVEYERRNAETGLENQCWKDSWDSIAFADGTVAPPPRATCEVQGYVYDAKRRTARLARSVWRDAAWADELERQAEVLKRRFNQDYWIADRGFFALALDKSKRQVDSLTSNIGHLLWSGIADREKAESCVRHLMGDAMFSGWGIRTMATTEGSYNPIGYHVGTVWPHDNSIVSWGLRRYGYREESARIAAAMLEAAEYFNHRLPEAFAGYPRELTEYPVEYPTACSPQAWATAAPLLLVRTMLGLDSDGSHLIIDPAVPRGIERLEVLDIPGCWGKMDAFGRARRMAA